MSPKIINEQKLSLTGVVDPGSAKRLGSILGVDAIVSGTIADRGQSLKVNARLLSTETGEIFSAAAVEMEKDQEVAALMKGGATGSSMPQDSKTTSPQSPEKKATVVAGVFTFELQACKLSGDELTCSMNVTNNSDIDRKFNLFGNFYEKEKSSSALDSSAREYAPDLLSIGNSRNRGAVSSLLAPGVPVKMVLAFKDVAADIVSLNFLRVTFNEDFNSKGRYADFRNVPVVR